MREKMNQMAGSIFCLASTASTASRSGVRLLRSFSLASSLGLCRSLLLNLCVARAQGYDYGVESMVKLASGSAGETESARSPGRH